MNECRTVRSNTFVNGIIPSIEYAKSLTRSQILKDDNKSVELTPDILWEFREVSKFLHMATDKLQVYLFDNEDSSQNLNYFLSIFGFSVLMVNLT